MASQMHFSRGSFDLTLTQPLLLPCVSLLEQSCDPAAVRKLESRQVSATPLGAGYLGSGQRSAGGSWWDLLSCYPSAPLALGCRCKVSIVNGTKAKHE